MAGEIVADWWARAVLLDTFFVYASGLVAIGSALYGLLIAIPLQVPITVAQRIGNIAASMAILFVLLGVGIAGGNMLGDGVNALASPHTWSLAARTTLGLSAALGIVGMGLLILGFRMTANKGRAVLAVGATFGVGSFIVTGHAATATPVWLMAPVIAIHMTAAGFWLGALPPLFSAAATMNGPQASTLMKRFSNWAAVAVTSLVLSGIVTTYIQVRSVTALIETSYGHWLLFKLSAFVGLLLLAAGNKLYLTPRLESGRGRASVSMRRSIALEIILFTFVVAAAAALAAVEPPRE